LITQKDEELEKLRNEVSEEKQEKSHGKSHG